MFEFRPYQKLAVDAAISFFQNKKNGNAIEILPTGSGKSLIIETGEKLD
jgi:superfamily II DNA or RNA helicase